MEDGRHDRREKRFRATFPVEVEGETGTTVDMSVSGISFESKRDYKVGDEIKVFVHVGRKNVSSRMRLECSARVVRVEATEKGSRIGAVVEWAEDEIDIQTLV